MSFNILFGYYYLKSVFSKPKVNYKPIEEKIGIPPLPIKDISDDLPQHKKRKWKTRPIKAINTVIVHQTAAQGQSFKGINKYHITPSPNNHISTKGAPKICYHYGIDHDGQCYKFNDEKFIAWHCKGHNTNSIGVLVNGLFRGPRGLEDSNGDEPTIIQIHSLKRLLNIIARDKNREVVGHCEKNPKYKSACPGYTVMEQIKLWRSL